jgi:hypothetical protein
MVPSFSTVSPPKLIDALVESEALPERAWPPEIVPEMEGPDVAWVPETLPEMDGPDVVCPLEALPEMEGPDIACRPETEREGPDMPCPPEAEMPPETPFKHSKKKKRIKNP